jgi:hypothetical protein
MPNVRCQLGWLMTARCIIAGPLILSYLLSAILHLTPQASAVAQPSPATPAKKSCACRCAGGCGGECCCSSAQKSSEENQHAPSNATGLVIKSLECSGPQSFWLLVSAQIMPTPTLPFCLDVNSAVLEAFPSAGWSIFAVSPLVPPPRFG